MVTGPVMGGSAERTGGVAANKAVTITGGALNGSIFGGVAGLSATGNTVDISGGTIYVASIVGGAASSGAATGNTVTISGTPTISSSIVLYGGACMGSCSDLFTGNTLNLKTVGLTVAHLANFDKLNFYLPTTFTATDGAVLTVTGNADLTNGGSTSSTVNVGINGASSALAVGDAVTLVHANGTLAITAGLNTTASGSGMLGVTLELDYVFGISAVGNNLPRHRPVGRRHRREQGAVRRRRLRGFPRQRGRRSRRRQGHGQRRQRRRGRLVVVWRGVRGSLRGETGSHIDVAGASLLAGLSRDADLSIGRLTTSVFAEFGSGAYDTFNGFSSGDVRGHVDSTYIGGGLLGHIDFHPAGLGHAYAEASARFGSAHTSFNSADLTSGGVAAGYDASSLYAGASAAIGYVWNLSEATTVDVSGKYLWSRLGGDSVRLTTGETVDFDAVSSERIRLGARLSYALSNKITPYAGAAWEHEFDGKARATTNGLAIDAPSMRGDTGILEAGLTLKPADDLPLSIDLGLQGFVGQREGVADSFQARLTF